MNIEEMHEILGYRKCINDDCFPGIFLNDDGDLFLITESPDGDIAIYLEQCFSEEDGTPFTFFKLSEFYLGWGMFYEIGSIYLIRSEDEETAEAGYMKLGNNTLFLTCLDSNGNLVDLEIRGVNINDHGDSNISLISQWSVESKYFPERELFAIYPLQCGTPIILKYAEN